jgi:hypothetical protein
LAELLLQAVFRCLLALVRYALPLIRRYAWSTFQSSWPMLALLAVAIVSSLPLWRPALPSLFVSSVASLTVALWTCSLLWRLAELLLQAVFRCLLALVRYALPLIRRYAWSTVQSSSSMLAFLASWLPSWRPSLPSLLPMLACCPATTAAAATTTPVQRRREHQVDIGPSDLLQLARSIDACFSATHTPVQPAHVLVQPALVSTSSTRRRERRVDIGPSDLLQLARSIDACFNAVFAPAPERDDMGDLLLVNNTRRRRAMGRMMQHPHH